MLLRKDTRSQDSEKQQKRADVLKNLSALFEGREIVLDAFESKIFPVKANGCGCLDSKPSNFKILTSKQMLQRFPIALVQMIQEVN